MSEMLQKFALSPRQESVLVAILEFFPDDKIAATADFLLSSVAWENIDRIPSILSGISQKKERLAIVCRKDSNNDTLLHGIAKKGKHYVSLTLSLILKTLDSAEDQLIAVKQKNKLNQTILNSFFPNERVETLTSPQKAIQGGSVLGTTIYLSKIDFFAEFFSMLSLSDKLKALWRVDDDGKSIMDIAKKATLQDNKRQQLFSILKPYELLYWLETTPTYLASFTTSTWLNTFSKECNLKFITGDITFLGQAILNGHQKFAAWLMSNPVQVPIIFSKDNTKKLIDNLLKHYYTFSFCTQLFNRATLTLQYDDLHLLLPLYQTAVVRKNEDLKDAMKKRAAAIINGKDFDWEGASLQRLSADSPVRFHSEVQHGAQNWQQSTEDQPENVFEL